MYSSRSDRTIYASVLGPLVLAIVTLVLVSVVGFQALSAARAYVGAESLWSKARSQTTTHLRARLTANPAPACEPLVDRLAVPLGDRAARLALDRSPPASRSTGRRPTSLPRAPGSWGAAITPMTSTA